MKLQVSIAIFLPLLLVVFSSTETSAQENFIASSVSPYTISAGNLGEPQWYPFVLARGADRMVIQNTPITERPYRPMHFYGNAVRRSYFRGTPAPLPRDFVRGASTILLRR